jgi:hypothetical protein
LDETRVMSDECRLLAALSIAPGCAPGPAMGLARTPSLVWLKTLPVPAATSASRSFAVGCPLRLMSASSSSSLFTVPMVTVDHSWVCRCKSSSHTVPARSDVLDTPERVGSL